MKIPEYDEYLELPSGTVLKDETVDGVRYIIMRGPSALCGYLGIPEGHKLAGIDCWNYDYDVIRVHGGLTYSNWGSKDNFKPEGYWWIGWDYGHYGDLCFFDYKEQGFYCYEWFPWTVEYVEREILEVIPQFKEWLEREA
jgi:hypothetical protein